MSKIDHSLFSAHEHALEREYEVCPQCGSELVVRHGKNGPFLGCASYPACDYIRSLVEHDTQTIKVLDDSPCPECNKPLAVKNGRFGMFIGCTGFPDCHHVVHQQEQVEEPLPACPSCSKGQLAKRSNKSGKTFYSCNAYPKCKYILNFKPVAQTCPNCGWSVLIEKNTSKGIQLQCPQKLCGYKHIV